MCGAYFHSFCIAETVREIEETTTSEYMEDKPLFPAIVSRLLKG
jgi:hypothetical protein